MRKSILTPAPIRHISISVNRALRFHFSIKFKNTLHTIIVIYATSE